MLPPNSIAKRQTQEEVKAHLTAAARDIHLTGLTIMDLSTSYPDMLELYTDYHMNNTCDEEELDMQDFYTVVQPVLYSIIFFLGLAGNGLMVAVLVKRRHRLRITEIYLLHLAMADLMLIFTLPFKVVSCVHSWIFGDFLCMLTGVLENLNLLCGSFLLACIGFDRYLAIVHAVPSMQSRRPRTVHLTCVSLWFVCLLLSLPNSVFLSAKTHENDTSVDCYFYRFEVHSHNWLVVNRILHNVCFFFSLGVMSYCYGSLVITLYNSPKNQTKKGAIRLALLVTLVYCSCWLPYNVTSLINSLEELEVVTYDTCESVILLRQVYEVTYSLGISHCSLNPVLYAFVGVQFRHELMQLFRQLGCTRICFRWVGTPDHRQPSFSDGLTTNSIVY